METEERQNSNNIFTRNALVYNMKELIKQDTNTNEHIDYKVDSLDMLKTVLHADKDMAENLEIVREFLGDKP